MEAGTIEHEVRVAARPETIFAYFTDPARMVEWLGAEATLDPRPGGICRVAFRPNQPAVSMLDAPFGAAQSERFPPGAPRVMAGTFTEVDPPRRLAFTWGWEQDLYGVPPQSSAVEVSLTPDGDGTVVRLVHRRLPEPARPLHTAGWHHYLPRLGTVAEGGNPGADPWQYEPGEDPG